MEMDLKNSIRIEKSRKSKLERDKLRKNNEIGKNSKKNPKNKLNKYDKFGNRITKSRSKSAKKHKKSKSTKKKKQVKIIDPKDEKDDQNKDAGGDADKPVDIGVVAPETKAEDVVEPET